ncbi:MAG: gamma-glutamyl-gamma-aminobutyrate hydrolase family protein [Gammaproteobacteria bacterium]
MARVMVFKHVAAEPLGLLDPMIRQRGHRIRFVNFHRHPDADPDVSRYQALVVLGGPMQVRDMDRRQHLRTECRRIEEALAMEIPVLGICLGAQLLAHVLGAPVGPAPRPEIGWYPVRPCNPAVRSDPVLSPLDRETRVFQWHSHAFSIPGNAVHLADSPDCPGQAFRHGNSAWGFQFHLELDERLIRRWMNSPPHLEELRASGVQTSPEAILTDTRRHLAATAELARRVFGNWLDRLGSRPPTRLLPSR